LDLNGHFEVDEPAGSTGAIQPFFGVRRTLQAARICGVSAHDRARLSTKLGQTKVSLAELLAKDYYRERVDQKSCRYRTDLENGFA
jgi:hypothetical protein